MAAIGILEFNGNRVDLSKYEKFLAPYKMRGKEKRNTVEMVNYQPMKVAGNATQGFVQKFGGQRLIPCYETVMFPVEFTPTGEVKKYEEGTLRYYERKIPHQNPMGTPNYEPTHFKFVSGKMQIPGGNNARLLFMICSGKHEANKAHLEGVVEKGWSRIPPVWKVLKPGEGAAANAKKINIKFDAMQRVKLAMENSQELARQLYESQGNTDWDLYLKFNQKTKKYEGDWTEIENALMTLADANPTKILELINDAALDIRSKIVTALAQEVLVQEGDVWAWGAKLGKNKPIADRTIVKIPAGKGATPDAVMEWFANYLKGQPNVMAEINRELDLLKIKEE